MITEIINRRKSGIDCTEQESAEIKGWLREIKLSPEQLNIIYNIFEYFPLESGEVIEELENSK